ncbi:hypothetical protein TrVFT333_005642 [Trichoderma virens FT-333]|nr:hypothetical protein TrVFT333_005642 [Trichoderma virens FT-333]
MSDSPRGGHTDSIDSHDSAPNKPDKKKSRRPANTAFRQQRLKAWQPILTPKTVLPLFFAIGIIFAPIGGLLLYASSQVQEIRLDYTRCTLDAPDFNNGKGFGSMPSSDIETQFKSSNSSIDAQWAVQSGINITVNTGVKVPGQRCYLRFNIPESMGPPVLFYYQLTNFYQNHRRYADSFDVEQLKGTNRSYGDIHGSKCTPLYGDTVDGVKKPYYPCGLIANSMFNDSFTSPELLNPPEARPVQPNQAGAERPLAAPNWALRYPNGYTEANPPPNLKEWEAFQVWMRTAGLPTFSKLYQRNDTVAMAEGRYQIVIDDFFPTIEYRGKKSIIITTRTVVGGRNNFLGIAYIVVAGLCIVLGVVFLASHLIKPRKLGDHTYLSWNNVPTSKPGGSTAMASGREIRPGEA